MQMMAVSLERESMRQSPGGHELLELEDELLLDPEELGDEPDPIAEIVPIMAPKAAGPGRT